MIRKPDIAARAMLFYRSAMPMRGRQPFQLTDKEQAICQAMEEELVRIWAAIAELKTWKYQLEHKGRDE